MPAASDRPSASQTLSRGIRILETLADAGSTLSIDEIASRLDVHRSVAYRLLRTLEDHGLAVRDSAGQVGLGARLAALAAAVAHDLQAEALPELTAAANELGMTCFVGVLEQDACVTLVSVEPRHAVASVAQRPGAQHPVTLGAPGKAILAQVDRAQWPPGTALQLQEEVAEVARRGYATSHDEVIPSVQAVAVPLVLRGRRPAAIAALHLVGTIEQEPIAQRLAEAAAVIRAALDG